MGTGNRVSEMVGSTTTKYLVDTLNPTGYSQVLDELVNGAVTKTYTYGLQRISENQLSGSTWTPTFYGYDGHGNVRFTTSTAGAVGNTYQFDAFGAPIASTGTIANTYLYSGERFDSNLNLYHLRARYYNMLTGRFETMDQWQRKGCSLSRLYSPSDLNAYAYADADPVDKVDPNGQDALVETAFNYHQVYQFVLVSGAIYVLSAALLNESECNEKYIACLFNPWQPEWNRQNFGWRKPCLDCYRICKREGSWDNDKCPE
jgi:RHS repeat-associated protein